MVRLSVPQSLSINSLTSVTSAYTVPALFGSSQTALNIQVRPSESSSNDCADPLSCSSPLDPLIS